jgi:hypothetical protein
MLLQDLQHFTGDKPLTPIQTQKFWNLPQIKAKQ